MWQIHAALWGWAVASILLGLGFTFFSGATEAWLVDALTSTGFTGELESVFGRAQSVSGVAMLIGSVRSGFIAQATQPRRALPGPGRDARRDARGRVRLHARPRVHATPRRHRRQDVQSILRGSVDGGLRNRPVRWLMLAAPFSAGVGIYVFYALQPYLLQLYGDPHAYGIAGLAAAIVAGAQIVGGLLVARSGDCSGAGRPPSSSAGVLTVGLLILWGRPRAWSPWP